MSNKIQLASALTGGMNLIKAMTNRRSRREFSNQPLSMVELATVLWSAQGKTSEDGKRTTPSAGATFPLQTYVVVGEVEGLPAGLYHYNVENHEIELVTEGDIREEIFAAAPRQTMLKTAPASIIIAADFAITAAKYGSRAERYVYMEVGHAGQNVYLCAEALGLSTVAVGAFIDDAMKKALNIEEIPLYLMPVGKRKDG